MSDASPQPPRRPTVLGTGLSLIGLAILIWLGVWQLHRLAWKENLLRHIEALKIEPARPLAQVLSGGDADFVRVSLDCPNILSQPRLRLYGVQDGQMGSRLMTACPVAGGASSVLVDLGFVGDSPCLQDKPVPPFSGPIVGILRKPDPKTFVSADNDPAHNLWYWRDLAAMAKALHAPPPATSFVAVERGPPFPGPACQPVRLPIPTDLPNNHLQYAITWFGLAAALVGVYVAMLFRRRTD
jgi:surfeit locus 1 family protein